MKPVLAIALEAVKPPALVRVRLFVPISVRLAVVGIVPVLVSPLALAIVPARVPGPVPAHVQLYAEALVPAPALVRASSLVLVLVRAAAP
jgi:hypothetical protein